VSFSGISNLYLTIYQIGVKLKMEGYYLLYVLIITNIDFIN